MSKAPKRLGIVERAQAAINTAGVGLTILHCASENEIETAAELVTEAGEPVADFPTRFNEWYQKFLDFRKASDGNQE